MELKCIDSRRGFKQILEERIERTVMSVLPDEMWREILVIGVYKSQLTYKDLCCLSICCRRLRRLSSEDPLWSFLFSSDFPSPTSSITDETGLINCAKTAYKIRFEREREKKLLAHTRAVLRKQSEVSERGSRISQIERQLVRESENLRAAAAELSNLRSVKRASVALNVWQPVVVRGKHEQLVQQCSVPVESRVHSLEMELKLCRQQITLLNKNYKDEKQRYENASEELASLMYHPLRDFNLASSENNASRKKQKRQKTCNSLFGKQGETP